MRQPAVALAMAITVGLLGLAAASYPLYLASSASGALAVEIAQRCPDGLDAAVTGSGLATGVPAATSNLVTKSTNALVGSGAKEADLESPIVTLDATGIGLSVVGNATASRSEGSESLVQLASRTQGLQNITVISSAGGGGVWLPEDLAQSLGAHAGDDVILRQDPLAQAPLPQPETAFTQVRVAGIYASLVGTVLPRFWCSETSIFGTPDDNFPPPPVVLAPQGTLISALGAIKVPDVTSYQWERTLSANLNVPEATKALTALNRFDNSIGIVAQFRESRDLLPSIGGRLTGTAAVDNQLVFIVAHADAIERALRSGVLPVSIAGIAIAGLLVAVAGSYWVERRRHEVVLLTSRGASPASIGVKAALESVFPVVLGVLVGWISATGLVRAIGPSSALPAQSLVDALWAALAAAGLALALVGVVVSVRISGHADRASGQSRVARIPFELASLGLAIWAWSTLGHQSLAAVGTSAPGVSAAFLAFPILFVVSLAALCARLTIILLAARRFKDATATARKSVWLASRRLSGAPLVAAVSLASTAAAIGVLVYASALTSSQEATLQAKAFVFVGSTTSVELVSPGPVPNSISSDSTEVQTFTGGELDGETVDVLGIDPSTFPRGAFWDRSFSGQSLDALMSLLGSPKGSSDMPVILAGGGGRTGPASLRLPTYGGFVAPIHVDVVSTANVFPGESSMSPLVITTTSRLQHLDGEGTTLVWSRSSDRVVLSSLARAGEAASIVVSTGDVLDQTTFAAISWTFAYLRALGVLSGAVIVGGLLLFVTTRASQRALAYVLSRRMGLRRSTHWLSLAIELGAMIAPGALLGGLFGWIAVELAEPHLDPLPLLSPPPLIEVPYTTIAAAMAVAFFVWGSVSAWAQHVTDRSRASELLRADA